MNAIQRALERRRAESNTPKNWLCLTDGELYALLAGTVPESVKLAAYELTDAAFDAKMIQNSEKPEARPKKQRGAA